MKFIRNNWKKICFFSIIVILAITSAISVSVYYYSRNDNNYSIEFSDKTKLKNISINSNNLNFGKFKGKTFLVDEKNVMSAKKSGNILNFKASIIDNVYVEFENSDGAKLFCNNEELNIENNIYEKFISTFSIIKNSLNVYTILVFLIALPILYFIIKYITIFYKKIVEDKIKFYDILLVGLCLFVIFFFNFYLLYTLLKKFIILLVIGIILAVWFLVKKLPDKKFEKIYLMFAISCGIMMIFLMPPFNVPDESSHFSRAYKDSLFVTTEDDGRFYFPKAINKFASKYANNVNFSDIKIYSRNYLSDMFKPVDYNIIDEKPSDYSNVKYLSFVPYIPSTLIILAGRLSNIAPLVLLLLCRFVNLMIVIICCYYAIKNVPHFKKAFLVVTLFPIFIQQSAAINMDYLTNAVAILLISFIIQLIYKKDKITNKEFAILGGLCFILSLGKFGYFPILLLFFLVSNDKFKNKYQAWAIKIAFILGTLILSFFFSLSAATGGTATNVYGIKYLFTNPIDSINVFIRTAFARLDQDIFRGFFDGFAYSTVWHQSLFKTFMYLMYFVFIIMSDENDEEISKISRCVLFGITILVIGIVYAIAFSQWTKTGERLINGIQARYFLPVLVPIYIGISNKKFNLDIKDKRLVYSTIVTIGFCISFATIVCAFS